MEYNYLYDNFISTPTGLDNRIIVYNKNGEFVYSIDPTTISHTYVRNNCLIIKIFNKNDISLNFDSSATADLAIVKFDTIRKMFSAVWNEPTSGSTGSNGSSGTSGESSSSGVSGTSGSSGISVEGTSGTSGSSGVDGNFYGSSGTNGEPGTSGSSGVDGNFYGSSGTSGNNGTSGTSGNNGTSGTSGSSGTSGVSNNNYGLARRWEHLNGSAITPHMMSSNNSNFVSTTSISINHTDADNGNSTYLVDVYWESGTTILMQRLSTSQDYGVFYISLVSHAPANYTDYFVTFMGGSGTFVDGESYLIGKI